MPFAGLDVHKKEIEAVVIDDQGEVLRRERVATRRETLEEFARRHLQACRVALEATTKHLGDRGASATAGRRSGGLKSTAHARHCFGQDQDRQSGCAGAGATAQERVSAAGVDAG